MKQVNGTTVSNSFVHNSWIWNAAPIVSMRHHIIVVTFAECVTTRVFFDKEKKIIEGIAGTWIEPEV